MFRSMSAPLATLFKEKRFPKVVSGPTSVGVFHFLTGTDPAVARTRHLTRSPDLRPSGSDFCRAGFAGLCAEVVQQHQAVSDPQLQGLRVEANALAGAEIVGDQHGHMLGEAATGTIQKQGSQMLRVGFERPEPRPRAFTSSLGLRQGAAMRSDFKAALAWSRVSNGCVNQGSSGFRFSVWIASASMVTTGSGLNACMRTGLANDGVPRAEHERMLVSGSDMVSSITQTEVFIALVVAAHAGVLA